MIFRAGQFEFTFPRPTMIVGVVNVTPDSFSDGGRFPDAAAAAAHGLDLVGQGAEIIDVGGESTRPGAEPGSEAEELRRGLPGVGRPGARGPGAVFIGTPKPAGGGAGLAAGGRVA